MLGEAADLSLVADVEDTATPFIELGSTGLRRSAGYIDEEFLPQLRGRKAVQVYREMGDNDSITGAMLFAITQLLRNVDWTVTPAGKGKEAAAAAKFVEQCMDDMSDTWDSFIVECLSALQYGWAWHEIVYKRRVGPWQRDGSKRSKYTDGMIGWRRLPIRSQETLQRWVFDENGGVRGMIQLAPPDYKMVVLPIERGLLFRYGAHKGNPEGRSILRTSYRPWFYRKRLEEYESVGVERDLAGLPMVTVPSDYLKASKMSEQGKMVVAMQKLVRSVRRNEQEGIVFPSAYDSDTKQPLFKMELLGSGGARQFSTNELIQRYKTDQLFTVLADWLMVGHQSTGTYNVHVDKTGIFRTGVNAVPQHMIADVLNRFALPRLFAINGWRPNELPTITPSDVDAPDLTQLGGFMAQTAGLGFTWGPDGDMERYLRRAAGMPELSDDDYSKRRQLARKTEAITMAQTQTEYLAARSQLAQAQAETAMTEAGEPLPDEAAMNAQAQAGQEDRGQAQEQAGFDRRMQLRDRSAADADRRSQQRQSGFDNKLKSVSTAVDMETKLRQSSQGPSGNKTRGGASRGSKKR
jgi:hypothetical protein